MTTCTKTTNTVTKYPLIEISAKSENRGITHSKKIKGDKTAAKEIVINLVIYIRSNTIETIKKISKKTKVIIGVVLFKIEVKFIAFKIQA
jgi:hypothetical protein